MKKLEENFKSLGIEFGKERRLVFVWEVSTDNPPEAPKVAEEEKEAIGLIERFGEGVKVEWNKDKKFKSVIKEMAAKILKQGGEDNNKLPKIEGVLVSGLGGNLNDMDKKLNDESVSKIVLERSSNGVMVWGFYKMGKERLQKVDVKFGDKEPVLLKSDFEKGAGEIRDEELKKEKKMALEIWNKVKEKNVVEVGKGSGNENVDQFFDRVLGELGVKDLVNNDNENRRMVLNILFGGFLKKFREDGEKITNKEGLEKLHGLLKGNKLKLKLKVVQAGEVRWEVVDDSNKNFNLTKQKSGWKSEKVSGSGSGVLFASVMKEAVEEEEKKKKEEEEEKKKKEKKQREIGEVGQVRGRSVVVGDIYNWDDVKSRLARDNAELIGRLNQLSIDDGYLKDNNVGLVVIDRGKLYLFKKGEGYNLNNNAVTKIDYVKAVEVFSFMEGVESFKLSSIDNKDGDVAKGLGVSKEGVRGDALEVLGEVLNYREGEVKEFWFPYGGDLVRCEYYEKKDDKSGKCLSVLLWSVNDTVKDNKYRSFDGNTPEEARKRMMEAINSGQIVREFMYGDLEKKATYQMYGVEVEDGPFLGEEPFQVRIEPDWNGEPDPNLFLKVLPYGEIEISVVNWPKNQGPKYRVDGLRNMTLMLRAIRMSREKLANGMPSEYLQLVSKESYERYAQSIGKVENLRNLGEVFYDSNSKVAKFGMKVELSLNWLTKVLPGERIRIEFDENKQVYKVTMLESVSEVKNFSEVIGVLGQFKNKFDHTGGKEALLIIKEDLKGYAVEQLRSKGFVLPEGVQVVKVKDGKALLVRGMEERWVKFDDDINSSVLEAARYGLLVQAGVQKVTGEPPIDLDGVDQKSRGVDNGYRMKEINGVRDDIAAFSLHQYTVLLRALGLIKSGAQAEGVVVVSKDNNNEFQIVYSKKLLINGYDYVLKVSCKRNDSENSRIKAELWDSSNKVVFSSNNGNGDGWQTSIVDNEGNFISQFNSYIENQMKGMPKFTDVFKNGKKLDEFKGNNVYSAMKYAVENYWNDRIVNEYSLEVKSVLGENFDRVLGNPDGGNLNGLNLENMKVVQRGQGLRGEVILKGVRHIIMIDKVNDGWKLDVRPGGEFFNDNRGKVFSKIEHLAVALRYLLKLSYVQVRG